MSTNYNKKFPIIFYILIPLFSAFAPLAFVELYFILFRPVPFSFEKNMDFIPDQFTGYKMKPNSLGYYKDIPASINSHGHRNDEVPLHKKLHTFRILVLGDSFTAGDNVGQNEAYPQALERLLNQTSKQKVEVINAGVSGWAPFQYAQYYENYGIHFEPDLVIVGFFVSNDTYIDTNNIDGTQTAVFGRRVKRKKGFFRLSQATKVLLYKYFNTFRFFINKSSGNITTPKSFKRKNCDDFATFYTGLYSGRMSNHLKHKKISNEQYKLMGNNIQQIARIKKISEKNKTHFIVVLIPDENQVNKSLQQALFSSTNPFLKNISKPDNYNFKMPQKLLNELFSDDAIKTIDLLDAFQADDRCLYQNDTHWIPDGHMLAAAIIEGEVLPLIDQQTFTE
jgi:lysophospholipase L1-like esterase